MSFTWYGNQTDVESCNLASLAVVYPLMQRMKIAEIVDRHLPKDPQAEFSVGTTLSLLIAARLYDPVALTNVAEWAEDSGADILFDMPPEKINDDRLGRALDRLFEQRHSILSSVALHVCKEFDVPLTELHYDPTHLLFEGAYESSTPREGVIGERSGEEHICSDDELAAAHITKGRSTDDAPKAR